MTSQSGKVRSETMSDPNFTGLVPLQGKDREVYDLLESSWAKTYEAIRTGESISKVLSEPSNLCSVITTGKYLGKVLGTGTYGKVYELKLVGVGIKRYAVKKTNLSVDFVSPGNHTYLDLQAQYHIKAEKIIAYNHSASRKIVLPTDKIKSGVVIPLFMQSCILNGSKSYNRVDNGGVTALVSGDHVCDGNKTEFAILMLTSGLYRRGISINFIDMFSVVTCGETMTLGYQSVGNPTPQQYTFMERVSTTLRKMIACLRAPAPPSGPLPASILKTLPGENNTSVNIMCITVQILHALYVLQRDKLRIVHGDLHSDNVFIELITNDTMWNGQRLIDAHYYEYQVEGKSIYIPGGKAFPFIVKIGDYGLSCKYASPMIVRDEVMTDGVNTGDGTGAWLPNFFSPSYDMFVIIVDLMIMTGNDFITRIYEWMLGVPPGMTHLISKLHSTIINENGRPRMSKISSKIYDHISPQNALLNSAIMKQFYTPPPKGATTILIGK